MPTVRRLVGRTMAGFLLLVMAAACTGPDLQVDIDNTFGPHAVTVSVDSSAPTLRRNADVHVLPGEGAAWSVPLGSTWEVRVDGNHVVGSGDNLAPPAGQDLIISIQVGKDGTVKVLDTP
jgi:hypothetical protein